MKITLALLLIRLLSWMPLRLLYWLALFPAAILYCLPWRKHRVITTNLEIAFPEWTARERKRLHWRNLVAMARLVLESGAVWYWSSARLDRAVREVQGRDHLDQARRAGRGVLIIGAHHGNWEINALHLGLNSAFSGLYKAPRDRRIDLAVTASRTRFGNHLIAAGSPAMRHMLRALKSGGTVGLLIDQQPRQGEGVFAPLFGRPALTMTLVNRLARRTGCVVIFSDCRRLSGGRGWELAYRPVDSSVADADPVVGATAMNRCLEEHIRAQPEQYLWLYKRFSLQPEGRTDPYRNRR
ncbi:lysophospholipid acyltransferase family protein [Wenzhouxiangella limi]|uniref:Lysophospholipid acyltransferase family protein n=1 Tax=Wenzhouxiangella limi TaxID=2707351 RepID=A0A845UZ46_9GAMM|nr:lysophospholipid acyltransferase family protein [Wenzhouxiangella limi]NDY95764.1 lysophospholipid acyltransferase family protein [Wenzhouxiangella limi]